MNQIKPCPVCKGPATTHSNPKSDSVCCVNEACPMWHEWIPLEKWNCRPDEDVLHAKLVTLMVALEWYANPNIYFDEDSESPQGDTIAQVDNGSKARTALDAVQSDQVAK